MPVARSPAASVRPQEPQGSDGGGGAPAERHHSSGRGPLPECLLGHHSGVREASGEARGQPCSVGAGVLAGLRQAAPANPRGEVGPQGSLAVGL